MNREHVSVGICVLAPRAAFHPMGRGSMSDANKPARVTKVIRRWRGYPAVVELEDEYGEVGRCNVAYLEEQQ